MTEKLIQRPEYLEKLKKWSTDSELIKIITGVRRCGKSKLLVLFERYLLESGVDKSQIHHIDLDLMDNAYLLDSTKLYKHVLDLLVPNKLNYVFLDEIQMVPDWPKVANSLRDKGNIDLYLTGSNAYMFSSKLSTLVGGRYIEIKMQPLSFKEYVDGIRGFDEFGLLDGSVGHTMVTPNIMVDYQNYIIQSGFPQTLKYHGDMEQITDYLINSVYNNTINKDIVARYNLRNPAKLAEVVKFIFDNISKETNMTNIEQALHGMVSNDTINKYINGLLESYMLYRCDRIDLKGKKILNSTPKYYVCDVGLRQALLGRKIGDVGKILENVVYLELIRRGYSVYVGKIPKQSPDGERKLLEVDFVATKDNGIVEYYQVSKSMADEKVLEREIRSLKEIDDNYPKYILTLDNDSGVVDGVHQLNAIAWLLAK